MPSQARLHCLDSLRAVALILGILLHAAMSFVPAPNGWIVADSSPSVALALLVYVIHMFRMSLFFLLAGFFGKVSVESKGDAAFARDRFLRIALPFVLGWLAFYPLVVWAGIAGESVMGTLSLPPEALGLPKVLIAYGAIFDGAVFEGGVPTSHLWFLYYLAMMYAVALCLRWLGRRIKAPAPEGGTIAARVSAIEGLGAWAGTPFLIAAVVFLALFLGAGWEGIKTPDRTLVPQAWALAAYGTFFAQGWALACGQKRGIAALASKWPAFLLAGLAGCAAALFANPVYWPGLDKGGYIALRAFYAASYALGTVGLATGFIGLFLRLPNRESPLVRYLADSSYWLYLAHLPLVMALQVFVAGWNLHWAAKFGLIMAISLVLLFASYELLVRHSPIGLLLNGKRHPWRGKSPET